MTGLLLVLSGCTISPVVEDVESVSSIGQRLLAPESGGGQGGEIQPYELADSEVFRMPAPLSTPLPVLPVNAARQSLPPVTVCLNVILDEQGRVQGSLPLLAHSQCEAGDAVDKSELLQAAGDTVRHWRFTPAAICHFAAGTAPTIADDCGGAVRVQEVPVTLPYAFTFEIVQGQARVRIGKAAR